MQGKIITTSLPDGGIRMEVEDTRKAAWEAMGFQVSVAQHAAKLSKPIPVSEQVYRLKDAGFRVEMIDDTHALVSRK